MSLDDIWSEPLAERPAAVRREKRPLFLSDSDDSDQGVLDLRDETQNEKNDSESHPDKGKLDAIFADVENEDLFADIDKPIDLEAMQRSAKAKIAATQPSLTIPTTGADTQTTSKKGSQRQLVAKLDEERLLKSDGFPRLLKDYKAFKVSGKGREVQDLEKLLRLYHGWTHRLFPKYRFQDTVERVEKLCRSRRMTVNLRVWRDEAHGLNPGRQSEDSGSERENGQTSADENCSSQSGAQFETSSRPGTPAVSSIRSESAVPSVPSSEVDMEDIDAMIREEEELMRELKGDSIATKPYRVTQTVEEEEALWTAVEGALPVSQTDRVRLSAPLEDDNMWAIVDDTQQSSTGRNEDFVLAKSPSRSMKPNKSNDGLPTLGGDWDDMYE